MRIKGKVEDWRIQRLATYNIVRMHADPKKSFEPKDLYGLPFDNELEDDDNSISNAELFEQGKLIRMPGVNYG